MSKKHLAIEVSDHSLSFTSIRDKSIIDRCTTAFTSIDETDRKTSIDGLYENHSFLNGEYDDITLSWSFKRSTLVPSLIFNDTSADEVYTLCYGAHEKTGEIDFNRIAEMSIVNVYEIPLWIKRYFVLKHPRILIQHEGSHVVRNIMKENAFHVKSTLILYKDYFMMTVVKHNNLEFYSFFDYTSHEDVVYHALFALQQKEFLNEKGTIEVIGSNDADKTIIADVLDNFKKVRELNQMEYVQPDHFIAKSQLLCV